MIAILNKIKPKRLSETLKGYVFKDKIVLDFGATKVLCYGDTGISSSSPLCLTHKDLYNQELDNAISSNFEFSLPKYIDWHPKLINVTDNSFFSAISGSGEDIFWAGKLAYRENGLALRAVGLNYLCDYQYEEKPGYIPSNIDYHIFYYLFQLTKHLTGKKTEAIFFGFSGSDFYITNTTHDYFVVCDTRERALSWKASRIEEILKIYLSKETSMQQVFKKVLNEKASPLFKALSRPFGDVLEYRDDKVFSVYSDERYKLWTMNKKEK